MCIFHIFWNTASALLFEYYIHSYLCDERTNDIIERQPSAAVYRKVRAGDIQTFYFIQKRSLRGGNVPFIINIFPCIENALLNSSSGINLYINIT